MFLYIRHRRPRSINILSRFPAFRGCVPIFQMVSRLAAVQWTVFFVFLGLFSFLTSFFIFRSWNRRRLARSARPPAAKTTRCSLLGLLDQLERILDQISSALAVVGLGLYLHPETVHLQRVGHTYAFSLALVQLLVSRRRGDGVVEGLRMVSIWMVHIFSPIRFNSATIPRLLQTVALLASLTELVERICWYASRPLPTSVRRPRRGIEYTYV